MIVPYSDLKCSLDTALLNSELKVYYQPQINLQTGRIVGLEALLRWNHKQYGYIPPATFIKVAEHHLMMDEISSYVLNVVCDDIQTWNAHVPAIPRIYINISASQFGNKSFLKQIVPLLHDKEISPDQLGLEVTEGVHWTEQNITPLLSLKAAGIFFSLDDFGKGVSGYNAIKTFPFDKVKIDRNYVKNLKDSAIDRAIVSSIMHLANQLNIEVIAEGVEDKQTVVILNELGCHSVQGYLYTKALPNDQLLKYLLTQGGSYEKANYNWSNC